MTKRAPSQSDEADRFEIHDSIGVRTLVGRDDPDDPAHVDADDVLYIEAMTGTRLKDGEEANWYYLLWHRYKKAREPNGRVTFADYCSRRYPERIDDIHKVVAAVDGAQTDRWSEILLLKQIAPRLGLPVGARRRSVEPLLKELGSVLKLVRGGYRVRLDTMDLTYQAKFDDSAN